jgi:hypothetical protein
MTAEGTSNRSSNATVMLTIAPEKELRLRMTDREYPTRTVRPFWGCASTEIAAKARRFLDVGCKVSALERNPATVRSRESDRLIIQLL